MQKAIPIIVQFGPCNRRTVTLFDEVSIRDLVSLEPLQKGLGYDPANVIVLTTDGKPLDWEVCIGRKPLTLLLETAANRKAGLRKRDLLSALKANGIPCNLVRRKGPHEVWQTPDGKRFELSHGNSEIPNGTARAISRQAGAHLSISQLKRSV